jgi:hypothetical protein
MTWHTFYTRVVPFLNTVGALVAVHFNVRAAYLGRPTASQLRLTIALMAATYAFAYTLLWTGFVADRAAWSETLAILSAVSWWVAWTQPARVSTEQWLRYVAERDEIAAIVKSDSGGDRA